MSQVAPAGEVPLGVHGTFSKGGAILGLETSPRLMADWGYWLGTADRAILMVFVAEIGLRLFVPHLAQICQLFGLLWHGHDVTI